MSRRQSLTLLLLVSTAPVRAFAQDVPSQPPTATDPAAAAQPDDEFADDEEGQEIVVQGQKPRGAWFWK